MKYFSFQPYLYHISNVWTITTENNHPASLYQEDNEKHVYSKQKSEGSCIFVRHMNIKDEKAQRSVL